MSSDSVSIQPGLIWLTRMPWRISEKAADFVITASAPFDTLYASSRVGPPWAHTDPMLTIDPRTPSRRISSAAPWSTKNGARTLIAMI